MYKDYAAKHEIDMHAELIECIRSSKTKRFSELKYRDEFLDITIASFPDGAIITSLDITDRKRAEETLRKERDKAQRYLDIAGVMFVAINSDGNVTLINKKGCETLSCDEGEIIGKNWFDNFIPERLRDVVKPVSKKLLGGKLKAAEYFENPILTKQGEERLIAWHNTILRDEKGNIIGHLSSGEDITERKKVEEALKESEVRYRELVEKADIAILMDDKEGNFIYFNKKFADLHGYSVEEMKKQSTRSTVHPEDVDRVMKFHKERLLGKKVPSRYEFKGVKKDGSIIYLEVDAVKLKEGGSIVGTHSHIWDITERKRAEQELREKEEFNFALFQYNPIETIIVDRGGRVLKVNMAKRKSGDRLPNIGDMMYKDYAAKHEIDMHAELIECIRSSKTKRFSELKYRDKFLTIFIAPFPQGAIITSLDITERKRTEEAVRIKDKAIASSLNAIAIADLDHNLTYVNRSFLDLWGYKDEREVLGRPSSSFWESKKRAKDVARTSLTKGSWASELVAKRKDRSTFIVQLSANLVLDKYGKPICMMASFMDISKSKQAEEALRESEEQYRAIFDQAPDSVVLVDGKTGELVEFNDNAYKNLGYTRKEFKKLRIPDFEIIESAEKVAKHIKNIIREGSDTFETKHRTKSGEVRVILVSSRAISIKGRNFVQSIWSDITDRKRAEEEIKNSQLQLRNLTAHLQSVREEERTHIAREMHDELGQALTAMKMDLSWLDKRLPKDQKPLFEKTKSMSKLADATLQTVKKISSELRPGLLDDLGLTAAIEWQAEEFQTRTGIKCAITVDPEDIILDKDRSTAIFRIFQETLTNVARHAKATRIKVSLKEKAGKIELKVRDNGKGITEKQVSNPKSFGLIGIRERAYYLDGKVVIKGLQDKGTALTIRIPLPKKGKTK
jgi:two-component system sensor histidine kinase UhpB